MTGCLVGPGCCVTVFGCKAADCRGASVVSWPASPASSGEPQHKNERNLDFFFARGCAFWPLPPEPETGRVAFSLICATALCDRLLLAALPLRRRLLFDTRWPIVSVGSLAVAPLRPVLDETLGRELDTPRVEEGCARFSVREKVLVADCAGVCSEVEAVSGLISAEVSVWFEVIADQVSMHAMIPARGDDTAKQYDGSEIQKKKKKNVELPWMMQ